MPLPELINKRHADRGGWNGVIEIANNPNLPNQESKAIEIARQYHIAVVTAHRWIRAVKKMDSLSK